MIKASIYIPAYNAEKTIESVINRIPKTLKREFNTEVLIIDDASDDETYKKSLIHIKKFNLPLSLQFLRIL